MQLMGDEPKLTSDIARGKAVECLEMARIAHDPSHTAMLEQMAVMWEQMAGFMEKRAPIQ